MKLHVIVAAVLGALALAVTVTVTLSLMPDNSAVTEMRRQDIAAMRARIAGSPAAGQSNFVPQGNPEGGRN